jgi:hypothetical protein
MRGVISSHAKKPPAASYRITCFRNSDAFVIRSINDIVPGEIGDNEAIVLRDIDDRGIATVRGVAGSAGAGTLPQRIEGKGGNSCAGCLVVNSNRRINRLNEMVRPDISHRVRGMAGTIRVKVHSIE